MSDVMLCTAQLPAFVMERFAHRFEVRMGALDEAAGAGILVCSIDGGRLDAAAIDVLPASVRAIATYSVGTDHIDLAAARRRGISVFNTPGVLGDAVAETAMLLLLGAARRATESIELLRSGAWTGWTPGQLVGLGLRGRTMGIVGMGDIGGRIAERARAFGMRIVYHNRSPRADAGNAEWLPLGELVSASDTLVLCAPSTTETRRMIDAALIAQMKPEAILVNIARGDLVDDSALIDALSAGRIYAAGLDVFDGEPALDRRYLQLPNAFLLPHIGSSTREARLGMAMALIDAIETWRGGGTPYNRVV